MSTYPSLERSSERPVENWREIPTLDSYFLEVQAEEWHPEDFERNTNHTNIQIFFDGLRDIGPCRLSSVSTFAGDILGYLPTTNGTEIVKKVQEGLELRRMAHLNQNPISNSRRNIRQRITSIFSVSRSEVAVSIGV